MLGELNFFCFATHFNKDFFSKTVQPDGEYALLFFLQGELLNTVVICFCIYSVFRHASLKMHDVESAFSIQEFYLRCSLISSCSMALIVWRQVKFKACNTRSRSPDPQVEYAPAQFFEISSSECLRAINSKGILNASIESLNHRQKRYGFGWIST